MFRDKYKKLDEELHEASRILQEVFEPRTCVREKIRIKEATVIVAKDENEIPVEKNLSDVAETSHWRNTDWKLRKGKDDVVLLEDGILRGDLDAGQHQIKDVIEHQGTSFPLSPVNGQKFYRTDLKTNFIFIQT